MVSRMTLILYILMAKRIFYVYEQPGSSLLWAHPRMEDFLKICDAWRCWTWMGAFGHGSPKGTALWSSRVSVKKLCRLLPTDKVWEKEMTKKSVLSDGSISVSGGKDLKSSQAYTAEYGLSSLSTWLAEPELDEPSLDGVKIPNIWAYLPKKDRWDDAHLTEVMQYLTLRWSEFATSCWHQCQIHVWWIHIFG